MLRYTSDLRIRVLVREQTISRIDIAEWYGWWPGVPIPTSPRFLALHLVEKGKNMYSPVSQREDDQVLEGQALDILRQLCIRSGVAENNCLS